MGRESFDTAVSNEERLLKAEGSIPSSPVIRTIESPLAPRSLAKAPPPAIPDSPPTYDAVMAKSSVPQTETSGDFDEVHNRAYNALPVATIGQTPAQIGCPHIDRRRRCPRLNVLEAIFFFPVGLIYHTVNPAYSCRHCGADLGRVGARGISASAKATRRQERRVEREQRRVERRIKCETCGRRRCRPGCAQYNPIH